MKSLLIILISMLEIFLIKFTTADAFEFRPYKYGGLVMKIGGTVTESYSDNITFEEEDTEGVFLTILAFNLNIQYEGKRRALGFAGRINRQISTGQTTNPSENLSLNFTNEFSKYSRLSLNNTFTHTLVPDSFKEEFGRIIGRFDSYSNSFNLNYDIGIRSKYFSIATNYSNGLNWSPEEGITDSHQNNIGFDFNYKHSAATNFLLSYGLATSMFEGGGNIATHSIATGIEQYITKQLIIGGSVGVVITPSDTFTSIEASLKGSKPIPIDARTTAGLSFSRGVQISLDKEDIFSNWQITSGLTRDILKDLSSSLSVFYGEGKFVSTGVMDKLLGASIALTYVFWEHKRGARLSGNFGYIFSKLASTDENRGYRRNTVSYGLNAGF